MPRELEGSEATRFSHSLFTDSPIHCNDYPGMTGDGTLRLAVIEHVELPILVCSHLYFLHTVLYTLEEEIMTRLGDYIDPPYLDAMAELVKQNKQRTYNWMHIQPGHAVLDVGCGPGIDTIALAELDGPTGRVVGVDADAAMIAEADRRAEQAGCRAWCRHQQGDATALPLETGTFDSCRSERLFQHVRNPGNVLIEMARVTRLGGWVVILDADHGTWSVDTSEVDIERRLLCVLAERMVINGYVGRQLYGLFKRQQFADINVEIRPHYFTNYTQFRYGIQLDIIEREALAAGFVTEEELNRWQQNLEEAETTGTFFAHAAGVLVAGRKAESTSSGLFGPPMKSTTRSSQSASQAG